MSQLSYTQIPKWLISGKPCLGKNQVKLQLQKSSRSRAKVEQKSSKNRAEVEQFIYLVVFAMSPRVLCYRQRIANGHCQLTFSNTKALRDGLDEPK
jgi:hypothetical protein